MCHLFADVVDEYGRHIGVSDVVHGGGDLVVEIGGYRVVEQCVRAAGQIDAVGGTIAYLAVGDESIHIEHGHTVGRHVIYDGVQQTECRTVGFG